MTMIPDINGDRVDDIVVGTLGDHIVLLDGWDGSRIWASYGQSPSDAVDAVGVLPDIDGNGSWEILAGNRSGVIQALSGGLELSAVPSHAASPEVFALKPNYPNPFNLSTTIPYELATDCHVTLAIYDLLGRRVTTLVSTIQAKGSHQVLWNGTDATGTTIASGVYFVQMRTEHFLATHKMMLLK
jgi:hypothetical protein